MSRSGYVDDGEDNLELGRWRGQVASAIRGKRGQAFLREVLAIMDDTPESDRHLIRGTLIDQDGCCCTIGLVCKARGIDVSVVDVDDAYQVGELVGIAYQMAAEIECWNDEIFDDCTPEQRWQRMREWVEGKIRKGGA